MPTMKMGGPRVVLEHSSDGLYEGRAKLGMSGAWQGDVAVSAGGAAINTIYTFSVSQ